MTQDVTTHRAILIAGPTASGKSALAITLARRHYGVVINADSCQVYRDLCVLSARPSTTDLEQCPHALYGYVEGSTPHSVGRWLADVTQAIADARSMGRVPIVVGGTGLYFKALLEGLSPIPSVPDAIRERWRAEAKRLTSPEFHALLAARDPAAAARIAATDPQRITRALEVLEATGRSLTDWQNQRGTPVIAAEEALCLVAAPDRATLYQRADTRFDQMIAGGALDEVRLLLARGYSTELPIMRALGVGPLLAHLTGQSTLDAAAAQAKLDTRHYIKRQQTWLRRNMIAWNWKSTQQMEQNDSKDFTLIQR